MPLKILCDENIPNSVVTAIQSWGHTTQKVAPGSTDEEVAQQAQRDKYILVTFDSDFSNILAYPPGEFAGIVRIKIKPPLVPIVTNALQRLFHRLNTAAAFRGKLFIVEIKTLRVWEE